jgi:hypothetical protein
LFTSGLIILRCINIAHDSNLSVGGGGGGGGRAAALRQSRSGSPLLHGSRARARLHTACKKTEFLQGCINRIASSPLLKLILPHLAPPHRSGFLLMQAGPVVDPSC